MKFYHTIIQSIRFLLLHRLRTFLSVLGVLFGVVAVVTMMSICEGSKREIVAQIEQLGTNTIIIKQNELTEENQKHSLNALSQGLTLSDATLLGKNVPFVEKQAALKVIKSNILGTSKQITPEILAITPSLIDIKGLSLSDGRLLGDLDLKNRKMVCIIGQDIAKALGKEGHVGRSLRIDNHSFQIVGLLNNKNWVAGKTKVLSSRNFNQSIFIPLGSETGLSRSGSDTRHPLTEIIVQIEDTDEMTRILGAINRLMQYAHHGVEDYQIIIPQELLDQAYRAQDLFNLVLGSIAGISMLVGGIGIMNIMLASISERTREIGLRRAIGASQVHIIKQFILETMLLTLMGATLGVLFGILFSHLIGYLADWSVIVTPFSIVLSIGMALGVGLASGIYPALKAARMNPISALRHF